MQQKKKRSPDPELTQVCCPECGGIVTCGDIVKQNSNKSIAIGKCENGDELFVRFKFTRWDDGRLSVARILYEMDDDNRSYYLEKTAGRRSCRIASAISCTSCLIGGKDYG